MSDARRNILWIAVIVSAAMIEMTWLDAITIQGVLPDLLIIMVVYFAMTGGAERAMLTGVLGGLFQDVAADTALGHHILCLALVGYGAGRLSTRLLTEHPAMKAGLVFVAGLIHGLVFVSILYLQHPDTDVVSTLIASVVPRTFYTALFSPLVFALLGRMFQRQFALQGSRG